MPNITILTGIIETGTTGASAQSLIHAYESNPGGFDLVVINSQTGVLAGSVVGHVVSITKQTVGAIGFLNVVTNTFSGAVTLLKIAVDFKKGHNIRPGDILALTSNIVGVIGTFAIMATGGAAMGPVALTMAAMGAATILSDMNLGRIYDDIWRKFIKPIWENYYKDQPSANYQKSWIAPDFSMRTLREILHSYRGEVLALGVDFNSESTIVMPSVIPQSIIDAGGIPAGGGAIIQLPSDWFEDDLPYGSIEIGDLTIDETDTYHCYLSDADVYN